MIYIFFTALFVCKNFHVNWPNDSLHPASTSFRAMLHIVMDDNAFCSIEALSREISCHHAACAIRAWDFSTLWRSCIGPPSQPKLASSLPNKRLSYCRLTGCGRNDSEVEWQLCHFCIFSQPPGFSVGKPLYSVACGAPLPKEGGLWHFAMHC